jgi:hypothetical protein
MRSGRDVVNPEPDTGSVAWWGDEREDSPSLVVDPGESLIIGCQGGSFGDCEGVKIELSKVCLIVGARFGAEVAMTLTEGRGVL